MAIKYQKKKPTLRILHEQDHNNPRRARHNKSMVDLTTLPVSLAYFAIGLVVLYIFSQTKGRLKATAKIIRSLLENYFLFYFSWTNHASNVPLDLCLGTFPHFCTSSVPYNLTFEAVMNEFYNE